jgi:hypothetical protein
LSPGNLDAAQQPVTRWLKYLACAALILCVTPLALGCAGEAAPNRDTRYDYLLPVVSAWLADNREEVASAIAAQVARAVPEFEDFTASAMVEIQELVLDNLVDWEIVDANRIYRSTVLETRVRFRVPLELDIEIGGQRIFWRYQVTFDYLLEIKGDAVQNAEPVPNSFQTSRIFKLSD